MRLFFVFARAYPISSALMVLGLVTAALAEGVGVTIPRRWVPGEKSRLASPTF